MTSRGDGDHRPHALSLKVDQRRVVAEDAVAVRRQHRVRVDRHAQSPIHSGLDVRGVRQVRGSLVANDKEPDRK
jgi:serine kinase of HPr protein (carbohydrate metabolism regulator)